jgi:hypothetical protein
VTDSVPDPSSTLADIVRLLTVPLLAVTVTVARPGGAVRSGLACSARRTSELDRDLCPVAVLLAPRH